jgi:hypothetical protein
MGRQDRELQRTHLSLGDDQLEWARENNINLSAEVRDLLDDRMDE